MDPIKQKQIASLGGKAAHQQGRAHEFTTREAAAAGRKGGEKVAANRQHMAEIGKKGGLARNKGKKAGEAAA
jgi:general stress protein YciG